MDSESVDLIYLDPPFNSGKQWKNPVEADGKKAVASFKDTWALSDTHADEEYSLVSQYPAALPLIDALYAVNGGSWKAYLIYMGVRLAEMRRILKPTGGIYYHCDPVMSHGVKLLMDAIFNKGNFINEIVWYYTGGTDRSVGFQRKHDIILYYGKKSRETVFNPVSVDFSPATIKRFNRIDKDGRRYKINSLSDGRVTRTYMKEGGKLAPDYWDFPIVNKTYTESTGYPTQKPIALLERIVKASSNEGGLILDPFCGCATTCFAAEKWERQWIGIDLAEEAASLIVARLRKDGEQRLDFAAYEVEHLWNFPKRADLPKRTDNAVLKPRLHKRQNGKCAAPCGENDEGREVPIDLMDFDHIIAKSRGGQDTDDNIQLLCRNCNTTKGGKGMEYLRRRILQRRSEEAMRLWREKWQKQKAKADSRRGE
ncbi:MAG: DNA methyltransferase [Gammaproteobacteria bacterium]